VQNGSTIGGASGQTGSCGNTAGNTTTPTTGDGGGVFNGGTMTLSGSAVRGNTAPITSIGSTGAGRGGGIVNSCFTNTCTASLTVQNVSVIENNQAGTYAGAIFSTTGGSVSVDASTIKGNTAGFFPGGLYTGGVSLFISNSTITANSAGSAGPPSTGPTCSFSTTSVCGGGGIHLDHVPGATATIINSTIQGNQANGGAEAGGIDDWSSGSLTLNAVTVAGNTAATGAGGIANRGSATLNLSNTIVSSNGTNNCAGTITDGGYNIDSATSCGFTATSSTFHSMSNTNPLLGALASNGGSTQTMALQSGSPAIDAIPLSGSVCTNGAPSTDQRGIARPQGSGCDIGAFELAPIGVAPSPTATLPPSPTGVPTGVPTSAPPASGPGPAPAPPTTGSGTSSFGTTGQIVLNISTGTSANGSVQVIGAAGLNTGVADLPAGFSLPAAPAAPTASGLAVAPPVNPDSITGTAPAPIRAVVSAASGGIVLAGNVAVVIPQSAIAGVAGGQLTVNVQANPVVTIPGGPAQFSPFGTILSISFTDGNGNPVTTFPTKIPIEMKYNASDVGQAKGDPRTLTGAYVIDEHTPDIQNPLHFPLGTFVIFPSENVSTNTLTGTVTVFTDALGSTVAVVTNPVGYVQTLAPNTPELSSFDPGTSQTFGTKPQFAYLQVVEPQIGGRLLVLDPDTGNYGYVNAADVGLSGAPPPKTSSAVVRGARSR